MSIAVALISDLMMQSQVSGAATRGGATLEIASTTDSLLAKVEAAKPRLVIMDLSHPGVDVKTLVPRLRALTPADGTLLAFGPHVHKEKLAEAVEAGCDLVMSRGQFHAQMADILGRFAG